MTDRLSARQLVALADDCRALADRLKTAGFWEAQQVYWAAMAVERKAGERAVEEVRQVRGDISSGVPQCRAFSPAALNCHRPKGHSGRHAVGPFEWS